MPTTSQRARSQPMQDCIDKCAMCHQICIEAIVHCLERRSEEASLIQVRALQDCTQICQTLVDFMLRESDLYTKVCAVCADVCEKGAEACASSPADPVMRACGDACRKCVTACQRVAGGARIAHVA